MPTVDFTKAELLADMSQIVRKVVKLEVMEAEGRIKRDIMGYIDTTNGELQAELRSEMKQGFDGVNYRLDKVEQELKGVKMVVDQHSVEIMELKAQGRPA